MKPHRVALACLAATVLFGRPHAGELPRPRPLPRLPPTPGPRRRLPPTRHRRPLHRRPVPFLPPPAASRLGLFPGISNHHQSSPQPQEFPGNSRRKRENIGQGSIRFPPSELLLHRQFLRPASLRPATASLLPNTTTTTTPLSTSRANSSSSSVNEPQEFDDRSPFDGKVFTGHSQLAAKATNARNHGAAGLILVNDTRRPLRRRLARPIRHRRRTR